MHSVHPVHNPKKTLFQNITYDNYFLNLRCNDLSKLVSDLESNVEQLNGFIRSGFDLSLNTLPNIKIITFDSSDNVISCIHSDCSGNFFVCQDLSNDYLPCVTNPIVNGGKISKTHISDISKGYPFSYPYYPYNPYNPYNPYYPYYPPYYRNGEKLKLDSNTLNKKAPDSTRDFPFYPYYPYYPYYPDFLGDDDCYYRDINVSDISFVPNPHMPPHPIVHPPMVPRHLIKYAEPGTHIHIHKP